MSDQPMKPAIDREACNGHGRCYMAAPDLFDCDDDGFPVVVGEATDEASRAALRKAVSNCPEQAISVVS